MTVNHSPTPSPKQSSAHATTSVGVPIYSSLSAHQQAEEAWRFHDLAVFAHDWWERLNFEFKLEIPRTALRLEWNLRRNCLGYFNPSHNEFGFINEIAIAVRPHVSDEATFAASLRSCDPTVRNSALGHLDKGEFLGSLLHEQLHLHQQLYGHRGGGNYHNRAFRDHAYTLGLIVTPQGYQAYRDDGPFQDLLRLHGIQSPTALPAGATPDKKVKSHGHVKLRKWTCGCERPYAVRVAIAEFHAQCLRCGQVFRPC